MAAPAVHYRISDATVSGFCDAVKYQSKAEAEAAATAMITHQGGPTELYIYALTAEVYISTTTEDATAP